MTIIGHKSTGIARQVGGAQWCVPSGGQVWAAGHSARAEQPPTGKIRVSDGDRSW